MASPKIESGLQLFSRLNIRPNIERIHPILFSHGGPSANESVEISGNASTGKTTLIMDLLARCLLPRKYNNLDISGMDCGAIIINTDTHFDIFRLINIMEYHLKSTFHKYNILIHNAEVKEIIELSLNKLMIMNCYDSIQIDITFLNLERILSENLEVGLVVLDSVVSQYWAHRLETGIVSLQSYCYKIVSNLQSNVKNSNIVIIFTSNAEHEVKFNTNYKILLKDIAGQFDAVFLDNNKNNKTSFNYSIKQTIVFNRISIP